MVSTSMSGSLPTLVGVGVVAIVLVVPPGEADAHDPRGEEAAETVVRRSGHEDLPVRGLVGEERHLGEDDAERGGDSSWYQVSPSRMKPVIAPPSASTSAAPTIA